ncbi:UNKNOWN [Stylonychia lemnae]|uniref:Uncharacterized protein n=1 Tax=Stylonychia lemnae TaxID=5949 RepID=A0A077ZZ44_STYLE|nr:UNKNOWN [Stylonychia lemnae]|eukprot:CDW75195.1 UNKNOWN [Stylonychia lemnae]
MNEPTKSLVSDKGKDQKMMIIEDFDQFPIYQGLNDKRNSHSRPTNNQNFIKINENSNTQSERNDSLKQYQQYQIQQQDIYIGNYQQDYNFSPDLKQKYSSIETDEQNQINFEHLQMHQIHPELNPNDIQQYINAEHHQMTNSVRDHQPNLKALDNIEQAQYLNNQVTGNTIININSDSDPKIKRPQTAIQPYKRRALKSRQLLSRQGISSKKTFKDDGNGISSNNPRSLQKHSSIDQCFPTNLNRVAFGTVQKAFVKPLAFKYGAQFKNKSEEARYHKISSQILKLRHLLINDPPSSHEYIFKFLKQFFSLEQISSFTDDGLRNFIQAIIEVRILDPNMKVENFIKQSMKGQKLLTQPSQQQDNEEDIEQSKSVLITQNRYGSVGKFEKGNFITHRNRLNSNTAVKISSNKLEISSSSPIMNNTDVIQSRTLLNNIQYQKNSQSPSVPRFNISDNKSVITKSTKQNNQSRTTGFSRNLEVQHSSASPVKYIMYSPLSGKPEPFVKNIKIPKLGPVSLNRQQQDGSSPNPKKMIYNYINQQEIRIAYEIQPPSCKEPRKECQLSLLSEIEGYNPSSLTLLQHERLEKSISTINYYKGFAYQNQAQNPESSSEQNNEQQQKEWSNFIINNEQQQIYNQN